MQCGDNSRNRPDFAAYGSIRQGLDTCEPRRAVTFGMNPIVLRGLDPVLQVGQPVGASYRFE